MPLSQTPTMGSDQGALAERLLKGLSVAGKAGPPAADGLLQLYKDLLGAYEDQPAEAAAEEEDDVRQACRHASLLYLARVQYAAQLPQGEAQPPNMGLPISRIIAASGVNLLDFFREVNVVVSRLSVYFEARGSSSRELTQQAHLKEHAELVVVLGLLAKKYKDYFNVFLHQLESLKQVVLRLGWNAFLVLKLKLLPSFPDVVSCIELLPCIFAILASHAPRLPDGLSHISRENRGTMLLKCMSDMCKADYNRVRARMPSVEALLTQILTSAVPEWRTALAAAKAPQPAADGGEAAALPAPGGGCLVTNPVLEGLVTDSERMNRVIAALDKEYEQHLGRGTVELDERDFLTTDFAKFASPRFSPGQMHLAMSKMRSGPMQLRPGGLLGPGAHTTAPLQHPSSHLPVNLSMGLPPGLHSPLPLMHLNQGNAAPGTPVSELMGAAAWLRGITSNLAAEPSPVLQRFLATIPVASAQPATSGASGGPPAPAALSSAPSPAAQQLAKRVRDMVAAVIPEETAPSLLGPFPLLQVSLASERRTEATKLYYYSLESIVQAEERTAGAAAVTALLSSTKFHRGLIACCVEVVAACYRMVSCAFPKVLDALRIKAFDLAKMIQSFVKSVATLPRELKRHLFLIEEKILESLAWEPGSSLYHLIINVHSEHEAALAAAAAQAAAASSAAASGDESQQHEGAGSKPASSSGGDGHAEGEQAAGAVAAAATSSHTDQSAGAPMETGEAVPAPAAAPAPLPQGAPPPSPKRTQASAFSGMMSPAKKARGADGSALCTQLITEPLPQCAGPPPATPGGALPGGSVGVLYDFFRKVLKLTAFRLALLCDNFDFSPLDRAVVSSKVYETIEHALYHQTHLFYNRHIDQVTLSALYGYCKVHKLQQVSFREIIAQYRKQPQAQQPVFRSVVIEQSNPGLQITTRADIIAFYNQVFVPAMKAFLLKHDGPAVGSGQHGADSKPAGNSGGHGTAAGGSGGNGATSSGPPGLPPLPPRSSSHSPRSQPKLPPLSSGPVPRMGSARDGSRLAGKDSVGTPGDAAFAVVKSEAAARAGASMSPVKGAPGEGAAGSRLGATPSTSAGQPSGSKGSARARGAAGAAGAAAAAAAAAAAVDHKIPDGLAALLQALDSQAGPEGEDGADEAEDAAPGSQPRSSRRAASAGRERRSRGAAADDDSMDAEGPGLGDDQAPSNPSGVIVSGRRQRTPNRRYGSD